VRYDRQPRAERLDTLRKVPRRKTNGHATKRQKVSSSLLKSVGYDAEQQVLEIEFQNGRLYQYFDVPATEYQELMSASPLGSYFNDYIRDDYSYRRIYTRSGRIP
jgi:hypothetical protein